MIISESELSQIINAELSDPHSILGMHPIVLKRKKQIIVRAFIKNAKSCEVVDILSDPEERFAMDKIADEGVFECIINRKEVFRYRLRAELTSGEVRQFFDPYSFLPTLGDQDLYLFNEGTDYRVYNKLGAHERDIDGAKGTSFAVWAPSAKRVAVVGDFNEWDGRVHPMRPLGNSGVWEIFIPGVGHGMNYKYELKDAQDNIHLKSDPYGTFFESPPHNASIVWSVDKYDWKDEKWMKAREKKNQIQEPMSVYEVHIESWRRVAEDGNRPLTYRELSVELVDYVKKMGYTHVEFMPVAEYPFSGSWGYQVTGFFAPTHRFGKPEDFKYLIDVLHQNGIGVILDWVPGHFPKDMFALASFDGTHLYEHADPKQGTHQDWGTYIFNYGRHEVCCFLIANAIAWFDRYHIDGLRVDAVASMLYLDYSREDGEWIPNEYGGNENLEAIEFMRRVNSLTHELFPGVVMIAEESTAWGGVTKPSGEGGLGFDFKWNMGWMHDSLEYFKKDPLHRKWHQNSLTFGMIYQYSERFMQVYSHDEVVHGKGSMIQKMAAEDMTAKANNLRALYAMMWTWPGKNTIFMGNDFGQSEEWKYDSQLDWDLLEYTDHSGVQMAIRDLNALYRSDDAFYAHDDNPDGFEWISYNDSDRSVIAYLRKGDEPESTYLVISHFTPIIRGSYRVGVPFEGYWKEILNTDSEYYGGSGVGNFGGLQSDPVACDDRRHSLELTLPGNSTMVFKYMGEQKK